MSQLPNDPKLRKQINEAIEECVKAKQVAADKASYISDAATAIQEDTGMPAAEFKKRVNLRFKQETNSAGYEADKEWADCAFEENDILAGKA